jgi:hypothetical protein
VLLILEWDAGEGIWAQEEIKVMGENYIMRSFMIFAHHIFGR